MIRSIHQSVICAALLTLFSGVGAVNVQASASPCAAHEGRVGATDCAEFLEYVRNSIQHWNESTSVFIPESTMEFRHLRYSHNWDANPVAYIPESTMTRELHRYVPNWDDNNVAYIPESTMEISLEEVLGSHGTQDVGK